MVLLYWGKLALATAWQDPPLVDQHESIKLGVLKPSPVPEIKHRRCCGTWRDRVKAGI